MKFKGVLNLFFGKFNGDFNVLFYNLIFLLSHLISQSSSIINLIVKCIMLNQTYGIIITIHKTIVYI